MKSILLISNMYPSRVCPYYGVFVKNCESNLIDNGYHVDHVVVTKHSFFIMKLLDYIRFYFCGIFLALTRDYDGVYAHFASHVMPIVVVAKKLKPQIRIITNVHGNDIIPENENVKSINSRCSQKVLTISDWVVAPSRYFASIVHKQYGVKKERILISPSGGVNTQIFFPSHVDYNGVLKNKKPKIIGFASRLTKNKGWDVFVKAAVLVNNRYPQTKFVIIGDGDERKECEELIRSTKIEEQFRQIPLISQIELAKQYNSFDIFCFPTKMKSESLGLVGLEAMACGVPCIISAMPGPLSYAINNFNCLTFEPNDENDLFKKIDILLNITYEDRKSIYNNQIITANDFSRKEIGTKLIKDFNAIIT